MLCSLLLYNKVTQFTYICIYIPFHFLFHYGLSQDFESSSRCYAVKELLCFKVKIGVTQTRGGNTPHVEETAYAKMWGLG